MTVHHNQIRMPWMVVALAGIVLLAGLGLASCREAARVLIPAPATVGASPAPKWGYIDSSGAWVIRPQFDAAYRFFEGLASVKMGDKYGYVDRSGNPVVKPQFIDAYGFHEGLARVATRPPSSSDDPSIVSAGGWGFIDRTGSMVIPAVYDDAGGFEGGLAPVMKGSKCGFIDAQGRIVIPLQFDSVTVFSEGLAAARQDGMWGYIDTTGAWVIDPQFLDSMIMPDDDPAGIAAEIAALPPGVVDHEWQPPTHLFHDGLALVYVPQSSTGSDANSESYSGLMFIDKTGKQVFGKKWGLAQDFSEGLAPVHDDTGMGYIDTSGKMVLTFPETGEEAGIYFANSSGFHDGLAMLAVSGGRGYMDKTGTMVVPPRPFVRAGDFFQGYAYVYTPMPTDPAQFGVRPDAFTFTSFEVIDTAGRVIYQAPASP